MTKADNFLKYTKILEKEADYLDCKDSLERQRQIRAINTHLMHW